MPFIGMGGVNETSVTQKTKLTDRTKMKLNKLTFAIAACLLALGAQTSRATSYTLSTAGTLVTATGDTTSDPYQIGQVVPGEPAADDLTFVNDLLGLALHTSGTETFGGKSDTLYRSGLNLGANPTLAVSANAISVSSFSTGNDSSGATVDISLTSYTGGFTYLIAKYDDGNAATVVWDIAGATDVLLPEFDTVNGISYGLSSYDIYNPQGSPTPLPTPDGGTTIIMLGSALASIGVVGRRFRKS